MREFEYKTCLACGEPFPTKIELQKYCSKACSKQSGFILCTCAVCGKQFENQKTVKYCSDECRGTIYGKKKCKNCQKEFTALSSHQVYCSSDCCNKGNQEAQDRYRYIIFERDGFRCFYCGRTSYEDNIKLHVDHIYPFVMGGEDKAYNLVTACEECNLGKSKNISSIYKQLHRVVRKRNEAKNIPQDLVIKLHRGSIPE